MLFCIKIWQYNFSAFWSKLSLIDNPVILSDLMREFGIKNWWWEFGPNIKLNYLKKNLLEKLLIATYVIIRLSLKKNRVMHEGGFFSMT